MYSLIFLCAGMCCPEEDDYHTEMYSYGTIGLIKVQNESSGYAKGDTLWIRTEIPVSLMTQDGEEIDLNQLSGNGDRAYIHLNLFWKSGFENPVPVTLSQSEVIPKVGEVKVNYDITATAFVEENIYRNEFGIILKETGTFFIGSWMGSYEGPVSIYVDSQNSNSIDITTTFVNPGSNADIYSFTVE